MKGDGLIHHLEIGTETPDLIVQLSEAACHDREMFSSVIGFEKAIERASISSDFVTPVRVAAAVNRVDMDSLR
ncbi:hypothetical protein ACE102_47910 (plasmid) [Bradyrhizobium sp. vgs-9]|uniref:hypothetical protein n=1 Tax=Bradyrhizobium sp. vgs-9 TaxID=208389 RepID=UPI0035D4FBC5